MPQSFKNQQNFLLELKAKQQRKGLNRRDRNILPNLQLMNQVEEVCDAYESKPHVLNL